jgi:N-acetylglucosamine-6-phosphate deacetylase
MERLRRLRDFRKESIELQQAIAGWHIEGPFLSAEPGFCGAHNPALMRDPTAGHIRELRHLTGTDPVLITVAPERAGAIDVIELAVSLGMKVSLGHTNASREVLAASMRAGATGFTHLGNGCPRELDRQDNILWRVLDLPGFMVSLIPDRIHVAPELFRLTHRVLGSESIYYTSDAMSAAGGPPGRYTLGRLELEVGPDQVVRLPGKPNFAGSALRPIEGVFRAAEMLEEGWQDAWWRSSIAPARFMALGEALQVGGPATFCLVETNERGGLAHLRVILNGEELS